MFFQCIGHWAKVEKTLPYIGDKYSTVKNAVSSEIALTKQVFNIIAVEFFNKAGIVAY